MDSILIYSNAAATTKQSGTFTNKSLNKAKMPPQKPLPNYFPKRRGVYVERQMSPTDDGELGYTNFREKRSNPTPIECKRTATKNVTNKCPLASTSIESGSTNRNAIKQKTKSVAKYKKSKYKAQSKLDKESIVTKFKRGEVYLVETPSSYSQYSRATPDTVDLSTASQKNKVSDDSIQVKNLKDAIEDPVTLVSQNSDNDKLYHFFLDLLENTLTDEEKEKETAKPKVHFNDNVGIVTKDFKPKEPMQIKTALIKPKYSISNKTYQDLANEISPKKHSQDKTIIMTAKQKGALNKMNNEIKMKVAPGKITAKLRRSQLLSSIKKQLRMDITNYEKPKTIYESLKNIARNKKLVKNARNNSGVKDKTDDCIFKRSHFEG